MDRAARSLTVTCAKAPNACDDGDDRPTLVHDRRLGIVHWAACDVAAIPLRNTITNEGVG